MWARSMLSGTVCGTFPLGGLVNHRVHSCIKGCLTLKFSGSWKTVTCSSPDFWAPLLAVAPSEVIFGLMFSFAGEIGMVSSGTGELDFNVVEAVTEADMAGNRMRKAGALYVSKWEEIRDSGCAEASTKLAFLHTRPRLLAYHVSCVVVGREVWKEEIVWSAEDNRMLHRAVH